MRRSIGSLHLMAAAALAASALPIGRRDIRDVIAEDLPPPRPQPEPRTSVALMPRSKGAPHKNERANARRRRQMEKIAARKAAQACQ